MPETVKNQLLMGRYLKIVKELYAEPKNEVILGSFFTSVQQQKQPVLQRRDKVAAKSPATKRARSYEIRKMFLNIASSRDEEEMRKKIETRMKKKQLLLSTNFWKQKVDHNWQLVFLFASLPPRYQHQIRKNSIVKKKCFECLFSHFSRGFNFVNGHFSKISQGFIFANEPFANFSPGLS